MRTDSALIGVIATIFILAISLFHWPLGNEAVGENLSVYYRLKASYLHGSEAVDFDIVAGCSVRVTNYKGSDSSFDAFRDPLFFVRATQDGGAVLQIVPNACGGETTENGRVPADFLPGAIWYENKNDMTLGFGYVIEAAFEDPKAKLRFVGATITKATKGEWEEFQPVNRENLGDPRAYNRGHEPQPTKSDWIASAWDKDRLAQLMPNFSCFGVARYHLTGVAARELVRSYWPDSRPGFWVPNEDARERLKALFIASNWRNLPVDDESFADFVFRYEGFGFPTRARGGTIYSGNPWGHQLPSRIYPVRADIGLPWLDTALATAPALYFDVDFKAPVDAANLYCYSVFSGSSPGLNVHFPDFAKRRFDARIDGVAIDAVGNETSAISQGLWQFYERDEFFYRPFQFDLH